jgi:hypothetical protein
MFDILRHKGNTNQNYTDILSPQSECPSPRKQTIKNAGEDAVKKEKEHFYSFNGTTNKCSHYENQKLKTELPYDPAITLLGIYSKECKST